MKVKIGDTIYDSDKEPIMVILSEDDKENIRESAEGSMQYTQLPQYGYGEVDLDKMKAIDDWKADAPGHPCTVERNNYKGFDKERYAVLDAFIPWTERAEFLSLEEAEAFIKIRDWILVPGGVYDKRSVKDVRSTKAGPLCDIGDLMTMAEWVAMVKSGGFIDYDGHGHYVENDKMYGEVGICPSFLEVGKVDETFTHVMWYNR